MNDELPLEERLTFKQVDCNPDEFLKLCERAFHEEITVFSVLAGPLRRKTLTLGEPLYCTYRVNFKEHVTEGTYMNKPKE